MLEPLLAVFIGFLRKKGAFVHMSGMMSMLLRTVFC